MDEIEYIGNMEVKEKKPREIGLFLSLVMIAVAWVLFYSMVIGLVWFGITAHTESSKCVAKYQEYIEKAYWSCGVPINQNPFEIEKGKVDKVINWTNISIMVENGTKYLT